MKTNHNQNTSVPLRGWLTSARWSFTAAVAFCAAVAQAQTPTFSTVWTVTNAAFYDLPAFGNNVRGMGISPVTTNVVYSSTFGGSNHISTLSYADGYTKVNTGSGVGVSGGTLAMQSVRIADDGAVYVCNRSDAPASNFKIYKWASDTDTANPIVVFNTGAGTSFQQRFGDYIDVRGGGENTEILVGGNGSGANITTNFLIFRPTDSFATNFTNFAIGGFTTVNRMGAGICFEGTNNAVHMRTSGSQQTTRVTYNPATGIGTLSATYNMDQSANQGIKYLEKTDVYTNGLNQVVTNVVKWVATVTVGTVTNNTALHRAKVLQFNGPSNVVVVLNELLPAPVQTNGNSIGLVDIQKDHFMFSQPNNSILFTKLTGIVYTNPPSLGGISGGGVYVAGFPATLTVPASSPSAMGFQWYVNTNTPIVNATNSSYAIPAVQTADEGIYSLVVTNPYGVVTSSFAGLTVVPSNLSGFATNLWTLAQGSRAYLTLSDFQRGLAYDAVSNSLVVVSRSPSNAVYLLDANTGADQGVLDTSAIFAFTPPGTLPINMVGVADDGAVYVGNLIISGLSDSFSIYRWSNADPLVGASQAYLGNPGITRIGDTMAVRGSGVNTEILCAFRTGTNVCLFTTADGANFTATVYPVENLPLDAQANGFAGLGLAFGPGNTFWAKSSGFNLRQVAYDTNTLTAQVTATFTNLPVSEAPLGADNVNGYIATVGFGQNPQNLSIWDVSLGEPDAVQLDRELFGSNNANVNGTGSVAVDVAGGRIFALDSNNGLIAVALPPRMFITPEAKGGIVTWSGPGTLQSSLDLTGPWADVSGATSPYTNSAAAQIFFRVKR